MTRLIMLSVAALAAGAALATTGQAAEAVPVEKLELSTVPAAKVTSRWKRDPRLFHAIRITGHLNSGAPAADALITVSGTTPGPRLIKLPVNGVAYLVTRRTGRTIRLNADGLLRPAPYRLLPPAGPRAPSGRQSTSARLLAPVTARARPTFKAKPITVVQPIAPLGGGPTELLVKRSTQVDGRLWLRVVLPIRPNGSEGWIPANVVRLTTNRVRIIIRQESHRIDVYRNGKHIRRFPVAVGKPSTPTPNGRFAIAEEIRTNLPDGFLGPFVLPITGYSRVLNEFAGGNGRVAIHGTSQPEVIGTRASNGCIRLYNGDIRKLAALVEPGAQVEIRPR